MTSSAEPIAAMCAASMTGVINAVAEASASWAAVSIAARSAAGSVPWWPGGCEPGWLPRAKGGPGGTADRLARAVVLGKPEEKPARPSPL